MSAETSSGLLEAFADQEAGALELEIARARFAAKNHKPDDYVASFYKFVGWVSSEEYNGDPLVTPELTVPQLLSAWRKVLRSLRERDRDEYDARICAVQSEMENSDRRRALERRIELIRQRGTRLRHTGPS